ncbi:MAG: GAF domain-containing protein [Anaerolineae bacterium]|nr:GAF domain-containing protein [Anaerolineae bacterium]
MSLSPIANAVVFKHLQNAVIVLNQHNQVIQLNLAAESLLATTEADVVGQDVAHIFKDQQSLINQFRHIEQITTEITVAGRHFEIQINPLREKGTFVGRAIVLHDITTRKETELALKQQNARMALLYQITAVTHQPLSTQLQEALTLATKMLGMELGIISRISGERYEVQYNFPTDETIHQGQIFDLGLTYCSITMKANHVIAINHMKQSVYSGHPCYVNNNLESYIGTLITVNDVPYGTLNFSSAHPRLHPFRQTDKEFVDLLARWIGTALERQIADTQLQANLSRTEALYRVAQSLIRYADLPDFLHIVTDGVAEALPANRVVLITMDTNDQQVKHVIRGGTGAQYVLDEILFSELEDGLTGWVLRESKPALSPKGKPDPRESPTVQQRRIETNCGSIIVVPVRYRGEVIGTLTAINNPEDRDFDTDDLALLEALANQTAVAIENMRLLEAERERAHQLQLSNEQLDAFSHMVAHDLKSPLALILGYVQLLMMGVSEPEAVENHLGLVFNAAQKMRNIISELLLLASVRKEDVKKRPLAMNYVVKEALKRLSLPLEEEQAQLILPEKWPTALGYGPWVEEIWVNYISNAIKYGGTPPVITLGADEPSDGFIQFWVLDNGPGIDPHNMTKVFQKFIRLEETRATGHGLGLAIVKQIAEMLTGEVGFENRQNGGTKFYFTLPTAPPD